MAETVIELTVRLTSPEALLDVLLDERPNGGVFVAGAENHPAGASVLVHLLFPQDIFHVRGKIVWRRTSRGGQGKSGIESGAGVGFADGQATVIQRLKALSHAPTVEVARRQSKRLPFSVKVRYSSLFSLAKDIVRDVSLGGLRIRSDSPPPVGQPIIIYLRPPGSLTPLRLVGEVVWRETSEEAGFGVRFLHTTPRDQKRLQKLIGSLDESAKDATAAQHKS